MVVLGTQIREQFGKLGVAPEALDAQLGQLSSEQLGKLGQLSKLGTAQVDVRSAQRTNRFSAELKDGRSSIAKPFANLTPTQALEERAAYLSGTYGTESSPKHASADSSLSNLLHPRRSQATKTNIALEQRPELRERVGTAVGALIVDDGRTDGVISVQRNTASTSSAMTSSSSVSAPIAQPTQSYGTDNMWSIMMAMDQAILNEAARLGLGQSAGLVSSTGAAGSTTTDYLDAMGLWSLTPDEGDVTEWMGFGQSSSTASTSSGMTSSALTSTSSTNTATGTTGTEDDAGSLDVQIMQLKRMIDKKTQMMELYSQSMSKYNQSANNIITNMKG